MQPGDGTGGSDPVRGRDRPPVGAARRRPAGHRPGGIWGGNPPKLIYAFYDSPWLAPDHYADTLAELQDLFYYYKNESLGRLTDDALLAAMRKAFDGPAQGSLEYLGGTALDRLCRELRGGEGDADDDG